MEKSTIVIDEASAKSISSFEECINLLRRMLREYGEEAYSQPSRTIIQTKESGVILTMPSYSPSLGRFAVKVVTEFKENPEKYGIPVQGGKILLLDSGNGSCLAILDSPVITEIRTASLCALASDILARKDARKVAVIGSGREARAILEALSFVRKIENVKVKSRKFENAERFAKDMSSKLGFEVKAVEHSRDATKEADIIIAATNSESPVISSEDVPKGAHVVSIGTLPNRRELDEELISKSSVFVDIRNGVLNEAGDIISAIKLGKFSHEKIRADIVELVRDESRGRQSSEEITLFKSVGFGLLDVFVSDYIYRKFSS